MPNLIDQSFFVRELTIPNLDDRRVLERLKMYIDRYEQEILIKVLGYYLHKAFMLEANGYYGRSVLGLEIKKDEQIKVGTTVGLVAGTKSFKFDGTNGTEDYRGYNLVLSEIGGRSFMIVGVDYSWNYQTGEFTLLTTGDFFQPNQYYNVHFENNPFTLNKIADVIITPRMTDLIFGKEYNVNGKPVMWKGIVHEPKLSFIANFVFVKLLTDMTQQLTGVNVSVAKTDGAEAVSPADKIRTAWNDMSNQITALDYFLWSNSSIYPEYTSSQSAFVRKNYRRVTSFAF